MTQTLGPTPSAAAAQRRGRAVGLALIAPALAIVVAFFIIPLGISFALAFRAKDGSFTLQHFEKSFELYTTDLIFTLAIVLLSSALIAVVAVAIAGYLTLGENPRAVAVLRWLYRWPLFIPFVVAGQVMRTFLAKNGMLNHVLIGIGLLDPLAAQSVLDWRGIVRPTVPSTESGHQARSIRYRTASLLRPVSFAIIESSG